MKRELRECDASCASYELCVCKLCEGDVKGAESTRALRAGLKCELTYVVARAFQANNAVALLFAS